MDLSPAIVAHRLGLTLGLIAEKMNSGEVDAARALLALAHADVAELAGLPAPAARSAQSSTRRRAMLRLVPGGRV